MSATSLPFDLSRSVDLLARTPNVMRSLLAGLDEGWLRGTEGAQTFSPFDVVGHLIDGEETDWMVRARIVLSPDAERRFTPYDRFRHTKRNVGRTLESLLDEFERLRRENLALLREWHVTEAQLERTGVHPVFGAVTLRQLLAAWVVHDLGHVAQTARVMAKQYTAEAGPWVKFLPVLTDRPTPRS